MFSGLRIFAPPEFPVLSLEVQAHLPVVEAQEQSQFRLLVRHFLERFFNNDMVSADGETKARLLQVVYAIALPGMVVALFLFPLYHAPLERPFWSQVSDHYFYVLYSFVAVGAVSIFAWDLLFPDLLDLFVLSPLPIAGGRLFRSRIVAAVLFLGLFLLGSNALGAIFYPLLSDSPGLARHLLAHVLAALISWRVRCSVGTERTGNDGGGVGCTPLPHHCPFPARHLDDAPVDHLLAVPGHLPVPGGVGEFARRPIFSAILVSGNLRNPSRRLLLSTCFQRPRKNRLPGNSRRLRLDHRLLSACLST